MLFRLAGRSRQAGIPVRDDLAPARPCPLGSYRAALVPGRQSKQACTCEATPRLRGRARGAQRGLGAAVRGLGRARGRLPVGRRGGRRLHAALHRAQLLRRGRPRGPRLRELPAMSGGSGC